jgi:SulP family sulfate permease
MQAFLCPFLQQTLQEELTCMLLAAAQLHKVKFSPYRLPHSSLTCSPSDLFTQTKLPPTVEPFATFTKTFSAYEDLDFDTFQPLLSQFVRVSAPKGHVLWKQGDESDGLYLIESGVLRASYQFADYAPPAEESMVPGALAGELTALSGLPRNATVVVEKPCVAWKLTVQSLWQLERENPTLAGRFIRLVLKCKLHLTLPFL